MRRVAFVLADWALIVIVSGVTVDLTARGVRRLVRYAAAHHH